RSLWQCRSAGERARVGLRQRLGTTRCSEDLSISQDLLVAGWEIGRGLLRNRKGRLWPFRGLLLDGHVDGDGFVGKASAKNANDQHQDKRCSCLNVSHRPLLRGFGVPA